MKNYLKVAAILGIICAVAAVILAFVNAVTAPRIADYEAKQTLVALKAVASGYDIGERRYDDADSSVNYLIPLTQNGSISGYILELNANGYGGAMTFVASFNTEGEILAVKMLTNSETPGLGKKSEAAGYMDKFLGTGGRISIPTSKSELSAADAQAVSGASVTFTGIAKALAYGSDYVKRLGGR
ncbi:MAG: FMN-binding protein [Sphaerochaetaceae bacterium]|nr:FMN-binding protein [Sphaerochaetaceae bacterium]